MFRTYLKEAVSAKPFKANNIAQIYKYPPPTTSPVTISVLTFGGGLFGTVSPSGVVTDGDVQAHWTSIGIPPSNHPKVVIQTIDGATNSPVKDQIDTTENTIDISMIGACCPTSSLTILLFISPNSLSRFPGLLTSATTPVTIDSILYTPSILSISWGSAEINYTQDQLTTINSILANAANKGINICGVTGDDGSTDGIPGTNNYVDFPGSSPYVTACGGTNLICPTLNYADPTTVEIAWTKGGGGVSRTFSKPTWQVPIPGAIGQYRCVPDIALVGDPSTGVEFIVGGGTYVYGGTSIVAPAMAAYYACLNTNTFLLPSLYSAYLAAPNAFHDITVGTNGGYNASSGYDLCTGLGSIAGDILTSQLVQLTAPVPVTGLTLESTAVSVTVGQTVNLTAVISPSNATNKKILWVSADPTIATILPRKCPLFHTNACGCSELCTSGCATYQASNPMWDTLPNLSCSCTVIENLRSCVANPAVSCDSVGMITGIAVGTTQITATTVDGQFRASASVTVLAAPPVPIVPVTGISLDVSTLVLNVGTQQQLVATIAPSNATNPAVVWTSSSTSVSVSNKGLVRANSIGSATVMAKTVDGGFLALVMITVLGPITSLTFSPSSVVMYQYNTYSSRLIFTPTSSKGAKVSYTSRSPNVANVSASGVITAYSAGSAIIQASVGGKTALLNVYVVNNFLYYATRSSATPIRTPNTYDAVSVQSAVNIRR